MCNNSYEIPKPLTAVDGAERRSYLFETNTLPTQAEIRREMGAKMANVFFEDLSIEGKIWLGLIPPLAGPDEVWISPDSRLEENARVTPVPEPKEILLKAFCHKNILEIGEKIRELIEENHKKDIQEALRIQALEFEEHCEAKIQDAVKKSQEENEDYCKEIVGTLMEHFEQCFEDLQEYIEMQMNEECSLCIQEEKEELAATLFANMQEEIEKHEEELKNSFNEYLSYQLEGLARKHLKQIRSERNTAIVMLRETIQEYEKKMSSQKTEMEASSVVDICRAINYERQQCNEYSRLLERTMEDKINELQDSVKKLKSRNAELLGSSKESVDEDKLRQNWKDNFQAVICEFQKFVNFALKSAPAQAEFLLNPGKLMENFPESDSLNKVKKPRQTSSFEERKPTRLSSRAETKRFSSSQKIKKVAREDQLTFSYPDFKKYALNDWEIGAKWKAKKAAKKKQIIRGSKERPINRKSSFYNLMTVVGEHEKSHMVPVEEFVDSRIFSLMKICKKNPEVAKMMLGCP